DTSPPENPAFEDVTPSSKFYDAVMWMANEGVSNGYADGTFRPRGWVTREAMAAFLYRTEGQPSSDTSILREYSDVDSSSQFAPAIAWFVGSEISQGYDDDTFRPRTSVTRESMAAFLYRLADEPEIDGATDGFSDVTQDMEFHDAMVWMAESGISKGYEDGTFHPKGKVTREAMAAFIYRFAQNY